MRRGREVVTNKRPCWAEDSLRVMNPPQEDGGGEDNTAKDSSQEGTIEGLAQGTRLGERQPVVLVLESQRWHDQVAREAILHQISEDRAVIYHDVHAPVRELAQARFHIAELLIRKPLPLEVGGRGRRRDRSQVHAPQIIRA